MLEPTLSRSMPVSDSLGRRFFNGLGAHLGKEGLKSGSSVTPGQFASVGVPRVLQTDRRNTDYSGCSDMPHDQNTAP